MWPQFQNAGCQVSPGDLPGCGEAMEQIDIGGGGAVVPTQLALGKAIVPLLLWLRKEKVLGWGIQCLALWHPSELSSPYCYQWQSVVASPHASCLFRATLCFLLLLLEMLFHSAGLSVSRYLQRLKLETLLLEQASLTFPYLKEAKLLVSAFDISAHNSPGVC